MNPRWQAFLDAHSAPSLAAFPDTFPDRVLVDLSHLGLLRVSGVDAQTFLQGQFTNDIRQVGPGRAQISAWCSPKGRMLADFLVLPWGEDYLLQLPPQTQAILAKRLPMYILRSKVKIADAGESLACLGIAGQGAGAAVAQCFGGAPVENWSVLARDGGICVRLPSHPSSQQGGETPRFLVVAEPELAIACWEAAGDAQPAGPDLWAWLDIRAGIPVIQGATSEEFVPQMANLDLIGGVSFTKGCYTGQEVVARMKYLGKLKRRMRLAHLAPHSASDQAPAPGDELFAGGGTASGQGAGRLVDARPAPGGGFDLLAVVENASYQQGDLRIGSPQGQRLEFLPLPYGVDEGGD